MSLCRNLRPSCNILMCKAQHEALRVGPFREVENFADKMSKQKDTALNLAKFIDKSIIVKLAGGREVSGVLKGYDQLLNLVLDESVESLRDPDDPLRIIEQKRSLGLTVCRGTSVMTVIPTEGTEEIENPFLQQQ